MNRLRSMLGNLLPSLVMAAGVTFLAAGLLSYAPSTFAELRTPELSIAAGDPLFEEGTPPASPTLVPLPSATQASPAPLPSSTGESPAPLPSSTGESPAPLPSSTGESLAPLPSSTGESPAPLPSATPIDIRPDESATPSPAGRAVATRIRIPVLRIDLPVVSGDLVVQGNPDMYPLCDVAMYLTQFVQPGQAGTTYIYAHAQRGMFYPLLRASTVDNGAGMIGALVEVYTSDDQLHLYEIVRVKRHATDLSLATDSGDEEQLVLQTSEGPAGTVPKLQVAAKPVSVIRATGDEARPSPQPRVCLPRS